MSTAHDEPDRIEEMTESSRVSLWTMAPANTEDLLLRFEWVVYSTLSVLLFVRLIAHCTV